MKQSLALAGGPMKQIAITLGLVLALATPASAQSLETFLGASDEFSPALSVARAETRAARRRIDVARGALLPSLSFTADYFRNETSSVVQRTMPDGSTRSATVLALDQVDLAVTATLPLVDVEAWSALDAAEADAEGTSLDVLGATDDVHVAVIVAWYELQGARAVRRQALERIRVAAEDRDAWIARRDAGRASDLEVDRAETELGFAEEALATAELEAAVSAQALVALTGLDVDAEEPTLDEPGDAPVPGLETLDAARAHVSDVPVVRAARARLDAAGSRHDAAWESMLPTLAGQARERYTNAPGFLPETLWTIGVVLQWRLDFVQPYEVLAADDQRAVAEARLRAAEVAAETAIVESWHRVEAGRARVRAAQRARTAATRAAEDAAARADVGRASQLDVLVARRDAFEAEVAYTLAQIELASAREVLQIRAEPVGD